MSWWPFAYSVAAQATMMNHATTSVKMQPRMTSHRDARYCCGRDALFDDRRLQVELHPRRDRRADERDDHVEVAVVADAGGLGTRDRRERRGLPVGMRQHAGDDVADVERRRGQEDLLDARRTCRGRRAPRRRTRTTGTTMYFDMPNSSQAARDAGELGDDVAEVGDDEREHHEERQPEAELLADEIAQALAGDGAHAATPSPARRPARS